MIGVTIGRGVKRFNSPYLAIVPWTAAISLFLIADIDSHRGGVVQVASQNLNRLATSLKAPEFGGMPASTQPRGSKFNRLLRLAGGFGRKARLQESPREGPESARKRKFRLSGHQLHRRKTPGQRCGDIRRSVQRVVSTWDRPVTKAPFSCRREA
jgi:hypothetical protein